MAPGQTKEFIQDKLRSAMWLIRSIHQRQRTIYKVTESIVKFQRDFLDKGIAYLKPLILRDVAEDIGMHESTVSRVTTNKYVHTPQGIFELKYFFNSSIARVSRRRHRLRGGEEPHQAARGAARTRRTPTRTRRSSSCCAARASRSPGAPSPSTARCWACCPRASASGTTRRAPPLEGEGHGHRPSAGEDRGAQPHAGVLKERRDADPLRARRRAGSGRSSGPG